MAQLASVVPDVDLTGRFLVAADYDRFDRRTQPTLRIVERRYLQASRLKAIGYAAGVRPKSTSPC